VKREAIEAAGDLKDSILYESHVPPDDKNQDLIRVASPLITPIIPTKHMNPLKHANPTLRPARSQTDENCCQMYGEKSV
jgi:hypothetical protein